MSNIRRTTRFHATKRRHRPAGRDGDSSNRSWLVTTCLAGLAGSFVVAGFLFGAFGDDPVGNVAMASVQPRQILSSEEATRKDLDVATAVPVENSSRRVQSVAFRPNDQQDEDAVPARGLSGSIASEYPGIPASTLPYRTGETMVIDGSFANAFSPANITTIAKTPPPEPVDEMITLAKDGSLLDHIVALGVTEEAARGLIAALDPVYPTNLLKAGQKIVVTLDRQEDFFGNDITYPVRVSFSSGPDEEIVVDADEDGQFTAHVEVDGEKERARSRYALATHYRAGGKIGSSLFTTAKDDGVPQYIISQMLQVFSYSVDFQRQIKPGDSYEVFYGNPMSGSSTKRAVLLYASLTLSGQKKAYYRHTTGDDGQTAYYDENGLSANQFLMRTPVSGARLTSGFGFRRHPLLGYSKMHTGVDFGLPTGTPIKAAGAGVVELAGRSGAYGIMVRIAHTKGYETYYAHMSRLAAGISPGDQVNQGQVIGYVGATGRATGPHLHYEIRLNGKPMNPLKVKAAGGRQLAGNDLKDFKKRRQSILALMEKTPSSTRLAKAGE